MGYPVGAVVFPEAIDYVLQMRSVVEHQSNPARLPDSATDKHSSPVLVNGVGLAARIPLLSDATRLELAGSLADARYLNTSELNHQPALFDGTLHWRAGQLFAGKVNYHYEKGLNPSLDSTWPERDLMADGTWNAEAGLRVTDALTLPVLGVFRRQVRYDNEVNRELYNRTTEGWQAAARYAGMGLSQIQAGVRHSRTDFPLRNLAMTERIDNRYTDRELFLDAVWAMSVKTTLGANLGYVQRRYDTLHDRDLNFHTFALQALWDYSPKTRVEMRVWRQPFAYDDDPDLLYAIQTGARASVVWRPTVKTALSLNLERMRQQDYAGVGGEDRTRHILRYGPQLSWQPVENMRWVLAYYRSRETGSAAYNSYEQNYVRLGVEWMFDNGDLGLTRLLQPKACNYRFVALNMC